MTRIRLRFSSIYLAGSLAVLGLCAHDTHAQVTTQVKARSLVTIDTSASMLYHFSDCISAGGDGDLQSLLCDNQMTSSTYNCSKTCTVPNGARPYYAGVDPAGSRMFAAKQAFVNSVLGGPDVDWGVERYAYSDALY